MSNHTAPHAASRIPSGVPTGGQFATTEKTESEARLTPGVTRVEDFASRFRPEIDALERRWRDEPDTERTFNRLIAAMGHRVLDASEDDRPGHAKLCDALHDLEDAPEDDDIAEEVIYCLQDITAPTNMDVVYDAVSGEYRRVADGERGHACPDCGNGYATRGALEHHRSTDCEG